MTKIMRQCLVRESYLHLMNDSNANKIKRKVFKRWVNCLKMTPLPVFIRYI